MHRSEPILEIVYPEHPTEPEVIDYVRRIRDAMTGMRSLPWVCLVDQTRLAVMPPELVRVVAELNSFAEAHGMKRSARVVRNAIAGLQSARIAREASLKVPTKAFESREAALEWLREDMPSRRF